MLWSALVVPRSQLMVGGAKLGRYTEQIVWDRLA